MFYLPRPENRYGTDFGFPPINIDVTEWINFIIVITVI